MCAGSATAATLPCIPRAPAVNTNSAARCMIDTSVLHASMVVLPCIQEWQTLIDYICFPFFPCSAKIRSIMCEGKVPALSQPKTFCRQQLYSCGCASMAHCKTCGPIFGKVMYVSLVNLTSTSGTCAMCTPGEYFAALRAAPAYGSSSPYHSGCARCALHSSWLPSSTPAATSHAH